MQKKPFRTPISANKTFRTQTYNDGWNMWLCKKPHIIGHTHINEHENLTQIHKKETLQFC
jgi:hypothetical protein